MSITIGLTPPFTYYGGKVRAAPWIIGNFPEHDLYVEPFGGSAAILLAKHPSKNEIYNDLRGDIVNFYKVLRDPETRALLKEMIKYTPYSRQLFYEVRSEYYKPCGPVRMAWKSWVLATQCFGGGFSQISRSSFSADPNKAKSDYSAAPGNPTFGADISNNSRVAKSMNNCSGDIYHPAVLEKEDYRAEKATFGTAYTEEQSMPIRQSSKESRLDLIALRLKNVLIENTDALKLIRSSDRPFALHYLDPPYHDDTCDARYQHNVDHEELLDLCLTLEGKVIISGYNHPSYDRLIEAGWRKEEKKVKALAANPNKSKSEKRGERTECLWLSPNCELKQPELF